jgi:hypothetical protein
MARKQRSFRPRLDALEGRAVLSTFTVTSNLGSGPGTLRDEIVQAEVSGDPSATVVFDRSLSGKTIYLALQIEISKNVDIEGPGAGNLAIDGSFNFVRIFQVDSGAHVTISGLTIKDGVGYDGISDAPEYEGGGVLNYGTLTMNGCVVSGNRSSTGIFFGSGGGIYNAGTMTLNSCTVTGNSAPYGGGIYNAGSATLTLNSCTVTGNYGYDGGGIDNAGTLTLLDSTVTGDTITRLGRGVDLYNTGTLSASNSMIGTKKYK